MDALQTDQETNIPDLDSSMMKVAPADIIRSNKDDKLGGRQGEKLGGRQGVPSSAKLHNLSSSDASASDISEDAS